MVTDVNTVAARLPSATYFAPPGISAGNEAGRVALNHRVQLRAGLIPLKIAIVYPPGIASGEPLAKESRGKDDRPPQCVCG